jgi:hypothetical protein
MLVVAWPPEILRALGQGVSRAASTETMPLRAPAWHAVALAEGQGPTAADDNRSPILNFGPLECRKCAHNMPLSG